MVLQLCVESLEFVLNRYSGLHGINRAGKLSQQIIARRIHQRASQSGGQLSRQLELLGFLPTKTGIPVCESGPQFVIQHPDPRLQ